MPETEEDDLNESYSSLLERIKEVPGLAELFQTYGEYDAYIAQVEAYFSETQPKQIVSTADHS